MSDDHGRAPLHLKAWGEGSAELAQALIDAGVDIEARDVAGYTPLMFAAWGNQNPAVVQALIDAGVDLEARHVGVSTPVVRAAKGNKAVARACLSISLSSVQIRRGTTWSLARATLPWLRHAPS